MYDDANEFFWSRANIDALIKRVSTAGPAAVERVESHLGYAALRARLGGGDAAKGAEACQALLHKTFSERPSWLAALYGFRRVLPNSPLTPSPQHDHSHQHQSIFQPQGQPPTPTPTPQPSPCPSPGACCCSRWSHCTQCW